jgi:hypothetical protein
MLGEQIGEEKGKVTGQRVLDIDESGTPKIETTFSSNAKSKGIDGSETRGDAIRGSERSSNVKRRKWRSSNFYCLCSWKVYFSWES